MVSRTRILVAGALGLLLVFGCGGGAGRSSTGAASVFRLVNCNLGCGAGTCSVTTMATNQDLILSFNDKVDPATANFTTFHIVERGTGSTPPGTFLVNGKQVVFRPLLIETDSGIQFGFNEGSDYEIQLLAAPESEVLKSKIGRSNTTPLNCTVRTTGIIDVVPGRPNVTITPTAETPPTTRDFIITLVFNDIMQRSQLVDVISGTSPTIKIVLADSTQSQTIFTPVPGAFAAQIDQNSLVTRVTFTALAPYPGNGSKDGIPRRELQVQVSPQIKDLAGNDLVNPGTSIIPLPDVIPVPGSFQEEFTDNSREDGGSSSNGLWNSPAGFLGSGIDPVTGFHGGGGPGYLGSFSPSTDFVFDTDSMTFLPEMPEIVPFLQQEIVVNGGVFMFEKVTIPFGVRITAKGSNPLRIYSRGPVSIFGDIDLSGEDADPVVDEAFGAGAHNGKYRPPEEQIKDQGAEPGSNAALAKFGGLAGRGKNSGGSGGLGGDSWYSIENQPDPADNYWDLSRTPDGNGYRDGGIGADEARYLDGIVSPIVHGRSGQGVGARPSPGNPISDPGDILADWQAGAGMGSWAWPPVSDMTARLPDFSDAAILLSHIDPPEEGGTVQKHARQRSRGGGGGGYWTPGQDGVEWIPGTLDPQSNPTPEPLINSDEDEFNAFFDFNELAGGGVADAAGGAFTGPAGVDWWMLDPASGLLQGGAGGGGGGCSQHGSYNSDPSNGVDGRSIDTFRTNTGAGGGAGGGAALIHSGRKLVLNGTIRLSGGKGGNSRFMLFTPGNTAYNQGRMGVAGGGGGSGGALRIEVNDDLAGAILPDAIDVQGGPGGLGDMGNDGGKGGSGLVRFYSRHANETLAQLQDFVVPDEAVDLSARGMSGPNLGLFEGRIEDGDFSPAGSGVTFNGNSSGVRSLWYEAPTNIVFLDFTGYRISCLWSDGTGPSQPLVYEVSDSLNVFPVPGTDPIWMAFQAGWGPPSAPGQDPSPDPSTLTDWIIPGFGTNDNGLLVLNNGIARMARFQLIFDEDQVAALIGNQPGAFFRVDSVEIFWDGE